ncbi:MAG TPA: alpha/beta hydrolase [Gemmatimonadota bacterium]|nr:alpha/beta hydrolase [Gemmatimonadota bacterium]
MTDRLAPVALALVPLVLGLALPPAAFAQADLRGTWDGAWGKSADTLAVTMRFEESAEGWSGSFESERLRVEGIPFTDVAFETPDVTIRMVGDATTMVFTGTVKGDSLTGTLEEDGKLGWFAFGRIARVEPARHEEAVRFRNGDVELAGTLLLPAGPGPHPAVVFMHGSGPEGRWASNYLSRRVVEGGTAALIWDKRGVGESAGSWEAASFEDQAGDVAAAVAILRSRPEIDPNRVGIHGHSQGGTIAPLAAVRSNADFVIGSAASGLPMDDVEVYSIGNFVGIPSMSGEEARLARAYVEALVDVAYHGAPRDSLDAIVERARGREWFFEPPAADDSYWVFSRRIADYDPLVWWSQVDVPVLLVYGSEDERVPVEPSVEAITGALESSGHSATVRIFEGADHTFRVRRPGDEWPRTVSGYPDAVIDWLASL